MHAAPGHHWTVQQLAAAVAVSRSTLDERFRQVLGRSPIRYLAENLLVTTEHSVAAVAHRVGYASVPAGAALIPAPRVLRRCCHRQARAVTLAPQPRGRCERSQ
ncbi:helix-turn-helix domain-containing protein [Streptomyces sp. YKOK-I1]